MILWKMILAAAALNGRKACAQPAEARVREIGKQALSGPFGSIRFCPTGGIRPDNAGEWLSLDTVLCVGGSWLYRPGDSMDAVADRARAAAALRA